ncbi:MAG TPA: hypothetical protein VLF39_03770 [Candidatus Saccharimonadales bacterium]|nr:hypothetical protein [Candidatus Saccharimonadales bacterium]
MKDPNSFPNAHQLSGLNSKNDPIFVAAVGLNRDEARDISEARFHSREQGEMIKRVIGKEAMIQAGLNAEPVQIDATPVSLLMHPTPETTLEHVQAPTLMLPEVATPDKPDSLVSA